MKKFLQIIILFYLVAGYSAYALSSALDDPSFSSADIVKKQIADTATKIKDIIPYSIIEPTIKIFDSIDSFRQNTYTSIVANRDGAQKEVDLLKSSSSIKSDAVKDKSTAKPLDIIEKPMAYIELFVLKFLTFVFKTKVVFYGTVAFVLFITIRYFFGKTKQ